MKKIILIAVCILAVAGCHKSDVQKSDNGQIRFVTNLMTKASASAFEVGDVMSVWAVEQPGEETIPLQVGGNFINNELLTFDGTRWNSARTLYWSDAPCDFYAVYPSLNNVETVDGQTFSLPTDQNAAGVDGNPDGYESADILYAKAERVARADGDVVLNFYHKMAKCSVNLVKGEKFEGEIPDDATVHIYNTVTDYVLNIADGKLSKATFGAKKTITMRKLDNEHFEAVVVPQSIELSTPLIEVTMGGIAYLLNYSISFKPAYNHTINLILNTSPDQEMIEINIDPEVENWN